MIESGLDQRTLKKHAQKSNKHSSILQWLWMGKCLYEHLLTLIPKLGDAIASKSPSIFSEKAPYSYRDILNNFLRFHCDQRSSLKSLPLKWILSQEC